MKVQIVDWHGEDEFIDYTGYQSQAKYVAQEVASEYFYRKPCDPSIFECKVLIKTVNKVRKFEVTAEMAVDFFAKESTNE